jgi:hypothetical protein
MSKINIKPENITGKLSTKIPNILLGVGLLALIATLYLIKKDPHHYYPSYLVSFFFFLTLTLGNMFFVLFQHISRAGWSASVRRVSEIFMANIPLMAILFIPIVFGAHDLYHWSHHDAVAADHLLQIKQPFLNVPFFILRAILFFGIWMFISKKYLGFSVKQDHSADDTLTLKLQKAATYSIILFALTITFAGIDWIMSLTPHWYSTIFGVYVFAGALVGGIASLSIVLMILKRNGYLSTVVTVEHFHDLGKLLYGFNIFWAYIAFCQYFLIWYGNIPEETHWYSDHFFGSWNTVAIILAIGHFGIPFLLFMSRSTKRYLPYHCFMAVWLLMMHFLDLYWIVMPTFNKGGVHVTVVDLTAFIAIAGLYFYYLFKRMSKISIIAINDPRIDEAINFQNY